MGIRSKLEKYLVISCFLFPIFFPFSFLRNEIQLLIKFREKLQGLTKHKGEVYIITAYSPTKEECDATPFITADGSKVRFGIIASDKSIPFRRKLYILGLGIYEVRDRGSAIRGKKLDLFYFSTKYAQRFGVQKRLVLIL